MTNETVLTQTEQLAKSFYEALVNDSYAKLKMSDEVDNHQLEVSDVAVECSCGVFKEDVNGGDWSNYEADFALTSWREHMFLSSLSAIFSID